jgi:lipoprotein-releasing system permease protein
MLIIEKKEDIATLQSLGAGLPVLRRIFLLEGWMITAAGAMGGVLLGLLVCWLQLHFGIVKIPGSGSFVIDTYPIVIKAGDVAVVFLTVLAIGYGAAWYPVRTMIRGKAKGQED